MTYFPYLWIALFVNYLPEKPVQITHDFQSKYGEEIFYYEDLNGNLEINDIIEISKQGDFIRTSNTFSRPPSKSVYWFKIQLPVNSPEGLSLLVGDAFSIWKLDHYSSKNEYQNPTVTGPIRKKYRPNMESGYFKFTIESSSISKPIYFIRIEGGFPKVFSFEIDETGEIESKTSNMLIIRSVYIGILSALIIYNFFLYLSLRDRVYLYYVCYLITAIFIFPFISGNPIFYSELLWTYYWSYQFLMAVFVNLFAITYLEIPKYSKRLNKALWIITSMIVIAGLVNLLTPAVFPWIVMIVQPILFIFNLSLLGTGIYCLTKRNDNAPFFILGWSSVILSMVTFILSRNGIVELNFFTTNILYFGVSIEAVTFALALGHRFDKLKKLQEEERIKRMELQRELEKNQVALSVHTLNMIQRKNDFDEIKNEIGELDDVKSKKLNSVILSNSNIQKDWKLFVDYFSQVHKSFFDELSNQFPELTTTDIRLAALIKLNLDGNQIATLLHIEQHSVRMARYRLKKKMGLSDEIDLKQYIRSFPESE